MKARFGKLSAKLLAFGFGCMVFTWLFQPG